MTTKADNRFKNIIKDLNSVIEKDILTAIKQLRKHGKAEAIPHLINLYKKTENKEIKDHLTSFLYDLKDQSAVEEIIKAIEIESDSNNKVFLLSILWQSALDSSEHLNFLVNQAINGNYLICIEVLTIIDNFDGTFQEDEITDAEFDLNDAIEIADESKKEILITIKSALKSLNVEF